MKQFLTDLGVDLLDVVKHNTRAGLLILVVGFLIGLSF